MRPGLPITSGLPDAKLMLTGFRLGFTPFKVALIACVIYLAFVGTTTAHHYADVAIYWGLRDIGDPMGLDRFERFALLRCVRFSLADRRPKINPLTQHRNFRTPPRRAATCLSIIADALK